MTVGVDGKALIDPVLTYRTLRGRGMDSNSFGVTVTGDMFTAGGPFRRWWATTSSRIGPATWASPDGTLLVATFLRDRAPGARDRSPASREGTFRTDESSPTSGRWARTTTVNSTCWPMGSIPFRHPGKVFKLVPQ